MLLHILALLMVAGAFACLVVSGFLIHPSLGLVMSAGCLASTARALIRASVKVVA